MVELTFTQDRHFPLTDLAAAVLVVPDAAAAAPSVGAVRQAITDACGTRPEVIPQSAFDPTLFAQAHVIACGHMAENAALRRLYTARACFVDTFFPGSDGYFVKSVSDPFGHDKNCVVVGASSNAGLDNALAVFGDLVQHSDGTLKRIHAHRFDHALPPQPEASELATMIQSQLDIWGRGWSASPFRGGQLMNYMWHYYLTDHEVWGRAIAPIFAGSLAPWRAERRDYPESYHCFFNLQSFIHLWDLIEDSPLYSSADRRSAVTMFGDLFEHLAGLFYLREDVNPPGEPRQNHATFIALNLAVGHDYMARRYQIDTFAPSQEAVERIFAGQARCYKPNDDAGVGYAWHVPQETLYYYLYKNNYAFIDDGHVGDLCRLAGMSVDNMRSEAGYGDTSGYAAFSPNGWNGHLWPLMVSTWHQRNPEHLWLLNWLGQGKTPSLSQVLSGLYAAVDFTEEGSVLEGCTPTEPTDLLGICAVDLPQPALDWVHRRTPEAHHPDPHKRYIDKLSLRRNFDPQDEYLLLEGVGTFCHGHEDTNAVLRLTWKNRAWLADVDYIRAAPKFHNSITVNRDGLGTLEAPGEGVVIPPLAMLEVCDESPIFGLVQTQAARYNGLDWRRNICWRKGRYFVVLDQLHSRQAGTYHCICHWRLIGEVAAQDTGLHLHQQGEDFYLRNADDIDNEIVPDPHGGGLWGGYPHADAVPQVLYQRASADLAPQETLTFHNLFTPYDHIHIERLDEGLVRITDGPETSILGSGKVRLGDVDIEGALFALHLDADRVTIQGAERLGFSERWEDLGGKARVLDVQNSEWAHQLQQAIAAPAQTRPSRRPPLPTQPTGGLHLAWDRTLEAEVNTVALDAETLLVGTQDGQVARCTLTDGNALWQQQLDDPAFSTLLSDIDGDGQAEALVGTTQSDLFVLDGSGAERWSCELTNISGRGAHVSAIATADLEGDGRLSVLAATAGWYVNAFAADGTKLWANWIRYHVITTLQVADVDGDGRAEVLVGNVYSSPLSVHNFDGSFRWSTLEQVGAEGNATTPRRGIHLTHMQLADVDGDGIREIVYGTADGWIYAVDPRDGAESWRANIVGAVVGLQVLPTGIAAASEYGDLYLFATDGHLLWHHPIAARIHHLRATDTHLLIATDDTLLRCDLDGHCSGALVLPGVISGLWSLDSDALCSTAGGHLLRIDLA